MAEVLIKNVKTRVVVAEGKHLREMTIVMRQSLHPSTKKVMKVTEVDRTPGRLFRTARVGETPDERLMNKETYTVESLVLVPENAEDSSEELVPEDVPDSEVPSIPPAPPGDLPEVKLPAPPPELPKAPPLPAEEPVNPAPKPKKARKPRRKKSKSEAEAVGTGMSAVREVVKDAYEREYAKEKPKPKHPGGQSGPALDLSKKKLSTKERCVLGKLAEATGPLALSDLAGCFVDAESPAQANSWARNSLRRPVRGGLVTKLARGTYEITEAGKARHQSAAWSS